MLALKRVQTMTGTYVHPNQIKAWRDTEQAILGLKQARVVLQAQPQVGKTSYMLWGAVQRAKQALAEGKNYVNIIAISDSNNALRDQTHADMLHALHCEGMLDQMPRFVVEHRANLKYLKLPIKDAGVLTVFTDEAHIAAAQGHQRDKFQTRVYAYQGDRLLLDVGATSFAHVALHEHLDSPYDAVVQLEPGPAYNSIEHMYDMGRIRQIEKLCDQDGRPTRFLWDRIDTLQRRGGYTIIRAIGKKHLPTALAIRQ